MAFNIADARKLAHRFTKTTMKSYRVRLPNRFHDNPLRIRPWFILFTMITMLVLAFLGFTNLHEALPLSDKLMRFLCFWLATFLFFFILDVDEAARRVWLWRNSGLILTVFTCLFCGGILSEIVQSFLPYKEFEFGDVAANLLGSTLGLYTAFHLERYYRHRREIARLYRPLDTDDPVSDEDEDLDTDDEIVLSGTQLLPLYHGNQPPRTSAPAEAKSNASKDGNKLRDVWDEREELFGIGDDSDDEVRSPKPPSTPKAGPPPATP